MYEKEGRTYWFNNIALVEIPPLHAVVSCWVYGDDFCVKVFHGVWIRKKVMDRGYMMRSQDVVTLRLRLS